MGLEKVDVEKYFRESRGDFIPIPDGFEVLGWSSRVGKKGTARVVELLRMSDKLIVSLFADQLRKEGEVFLVSKMHFDAQVKRAELYRAGNIPK